MIGFYSGIDWAGISQVESNRAVVQSLINDGVKHELRFEVKDNEEADAIVHWGMLEEEGFTAGVKMDGDHKTDWSNSSFVSPYDFINDLPASHVYFGHEVLEYMNWEDRQDRRDIFDAFFPDLPMIQYYGRLWLPHERVGKSHPEGGMYQEYVFGNEAAKFKGSRVIIHFSLGNYGTGSKVEPIVEYFTQQKLLMDRVSPHGHLVAVHFNVLDDITSVSALVSVLKHLYLIGAGYLYLRPVDGTGAKVSATQVMKDAIGDVTSDLGL